MIDRTLTITGKATLTFAGPTLFLIAEGGRLRLDGLTISGAEAPRLPGNAVIRSSATPMLANYAIELIDCDFRDMAASPGFDVIATTPSTLADLIAIRGSAFADISGAVIAGHAEVGKEGYYGTERVMIERASFARVSTIVDLFRGGTDESTYGPQFSMTAASVVDSGPILLSGVQETNITGNTFVNSRGIQITHSVGSPHTAIAGNTFARTSAPVVRELYYKGPARAVIADNKVVN